MAFYFILFLIMIISYFRYGDNKKPFLLFFLLFFLLSFLRWETGTDWESYYDIFIRQSLKLEFYREFGFVILNYTVRSFTDNYTVLLFIEALILYLALYKPLRYFSISPFLTLIAFFCLNKGGIFFTRQTIAISLALLSIYYLALKRKYKFILFFILAISFHYSAIIVLLSIFVINKKLERKHIIFLLLLSFFITLILPVVCDLSFVKNNAILYRFSRYFYDPSNTAGYRNGTSKIFIILRTSINRIFIFTMLLLIKKKYEHDRKFNIIFNMYFISLCLFVAFGFHSLVLSRITAYFEIFEIFALPYILLSFNRREFRLFELLFFVYLGIRLYTGLSSYYDFFIPYKVIFNEVIINDLYIRTVGNW